MLQAPFQNALVLTGPTASGKTTLAIELAEQLNAEIISMDSMALYRGMDIGTAKPTAAERMRIPHHLIDLLAPWESGSVAWWLDRAAGCCREIEAKGKRALFVGGTPLYLKALLYGLFRVPSASQTVRQRLETEAAQAGTSSLHRELAEIDPAAAMRIHANDKRRIIRALEVWEVTGKPMSEHQREWRDGRNSDEATGRVICLDVPRTELYARIDARVREMISNGWLDEVRSLRKQPQPLSREAGLAVGYPELGSHLNGERSLEEAIVQIQTRSRQFAKRQLTWFRHLRPCRMLPRELTFTCWGVTIKH